jgi:hypothetical protein
MLRLRIADHAPKFVVCYGTGNNAKGRNYLEHWRRLAGVDLVFGEATVVGRTVLLLEPHPGTHGRTNERWLDIGSKLRTSVESLLKAP